MTQAQGIAAEFHAAYERLAPRFGYKTRVASAVPWEKVPEENRALMEATVQDLIDRRVIAPGLLAPRSGG